MTSHLKTKFLASILNYGAPRAPSIRELRYDFLPEKRGLLIATLARDFPPSKIARTLPSPGAVLPPHLHPDSLHGRAYADVITKISRID